MNAIIQTSFISLLLASSALAVPGRKHHHRFHHKGTGTGTGGAVSSTAGPFSMGNSTIIGPTGTGTAVVTSVGLVATTIVVSPIPVSECGPATVTVTAPNVVTVTAASSSASYGMGNSTVIGATGTAYPTVYSSGAALPSYSAPAASSSAAAIPSYSAPAASSSAAAIPSYSAPAASSSEAAIPSYSAPAASSSAAAGAETSASLSVSAVDNHHPWTSVMVSPPAESTPIASSTEAPAPASTSTSVAAPPSTSAASSTTAAASTFTPPAPTTTAAATTTEAPVPSTTAAATTTEAPVPSTTVAATTLPSPPSGGGGSYVGPKRGIVYNTASLAAPFAQASAIGWGYNWGSASQGLASELNFVPMLWGTNVGSFASDAAAALKSGADAVMAMNEPDQPTQYGGSSIAPGAAAALYKANVAPLAGSAKLGAPAVSNGNSSSPLMGVQWLAQFFDNCSGSSCPIDFVPLHWYGWNGGTAQQQAQAFKDYVTTAMSEVHQMSGVNEFWVTEFSALPLDDAQMNADFMAIVLPWMDSDPAAANVARYSYFMVSNGLLVNSGGSLTASGQAYISDS